MLTASFYIHLQLYTTDSLITISTVWLMIRHIVLITNPTIPKYKTELIQVQKALMH